MSLKFESEIIPGIKLVNHNKEKRISRAVMTKFEATSIIGKRASALSRGIKSKLKIPKEISEDYIEIARLELYAHLIPFIVRRKFKVKNKFIVEEFNIYNHPNNKEIRCELSILKI